MTRTRSLARLYALILGALVLCTPELLLGMSDPATLPVYQLDIPDQPQTSIALERRPTENESSFPVISLLYALSTTISLEGFTLLDRQLESAKTVSFAALRKWGFGIFPDWNAKQVTLIVPAQYQKAQLIILGPKDNAVDLPHMLRSDPMTGWLNLEGGLEKTDSGTELTSTLFQQLALNDWQFSGLYQIHNKPDWQIQGYPVQISNRPKARDLRFTVGDTALPAFGFQPTTIITGGGISKAVDLTGQRASYAPRHIPLLLTQDAQVTVRINDRQIFQQFLHSGYYQFTQFPMRNGINSVDIEWTTEDGKTEHLSNTLSLDTRLLLPGQLTFDFAGGYANQFQANQRALLFREPIISMAFQTAISQTHTIGNWFEFNRQGILTGLINRYGLAEGLLELTLGFSKANEGAPGTGIALRFEGYGLYVNHHSHWGLMAETYSPNLKISQYDALWQANSYRAGIFFRQFLSEAYELYLTYNLERNRTTGHYGSAVLFTLSGFWNPQEETLLGINEFQYARTRSTVQHTWTSKDRTNYVALAGDWYPEQSRPAVSGEWGFHPNGFEKILVNGSTDTRAVHVGARSDFFLPGYSILTDFALDQTPETTAQQFLGLCETPFGQAQISTRRHTGPSLSRDLWGFSLAASLVFAGTDWAICRPIAENFVMLKTENGLQVIPDVPGDQPWLFQETGSTASQHWLFLESGTGVKLHRKEPPFCEVAGNLKTADKRPLSWQTGYLQNTATSDWLPFFTDAVGRFEVHSVPRGRYQIRLNDCELTAPDLDLHHPATTELTLGEIMLQ